MQPRGFLPRIEPLQSWYLQYFSHLTMQLRDFYREFSYCRHTIPAISVYLTMQSRAFYREFSYRRHAISVISVI